MNSRPFLLVCGTIFFLVGLLHLVRALRLWPVVIGTWAVPIWVSYLGLAVAWLMGVLADGLSRRPDRRPPRRVSGKPDPRTLGSPAPSPIDSGVGWAMIPSSSDAPSRQTHQ